MKIKPIEIKTRRNPWSGREITDGGGKTLYLVYLHGKQHSELWYNMKGYVGTLPLPDGSELTIGECGITAYKAMAAKLNREW